MPELDPTFNIRDRVVVKPAYSKDSIAGVWIVEKFLTKNYQLKRPEDVNGTGRKLRAKGYQIEKAPDTDETTDAPVAQVSLEPIFPVLDQGNLVTISDDKLPGFWIVVKDNSYKGGRVHVVKFGGDDGRYWNVSRAKVDLIDINRVTIVIN